MLLRDRVQGSDSEDEHTCVISYNPLELDAEILVSPGHVLDSITALNFENCTLPDTVNEVFSLLRVIFD